MAASVVFAQVADGDYNQRKVLCGYGGGRANCDPILTTNSVASFMAFRTDDDDDDFCFLTDTSYAGAPAACRAMKLYGNGVITYSTGGLYEYTDRQSSRNQYERGEVEYALGGGGGWGSGHSQGGPEFGLSGTDLYVLRRGKGGVPNDHFDFYELRRGFYKFGYYDCDRIVEGGSIDDYQYHYYCADNFDLFEGCLRRCGVGDYAQGLADFRTFNFTSSLLGSIGESQTSQIFS